MTAPSFWHMGGGLYTAVDGRAEIVPYMDARELASDLCRYALVEADAARRQDIASTAASIFAAITERGRWMRCAGWPPEDIGQGGAGESQRRINSLPPLATGRYVGGLGL